MAMAVAPLRPNAPTPCSDNLKAAEERIATLVDPVTAHASPTTHPHTRTRTPTPGATATDQTTGELGWKHTHTYGTYALMHCIAHTHTHTTSIATPDDAERARPLPGTGAFALQTELPDWLAHPSPD